MDMCAQCDAKNTMLIVVCCACNNDLMLHLFGSDMSSRNANLRLSVCPFVCSSAPNLSEAFNLHLFGSGSLQKHSERIKHLESTQSNQRALSKHSKRKSNTTGA